MNRADALRQMLEQDPGNNFARYGLGMELVKSGNLQEAASAFRGVIARDPSYLYAYFQGGQVLEKLGREEEAQEMYRQGVEAAAAKGDKHAEAELQNALDLLG